MTWNNEDEATTPPFLLEFGDDAPPEAHQITELTELVVEKILRSYRRGDELTDDQARDMILAGMTYGWQFAQHTGAVEQTIASHRSAAKRRDAAAAKHHEFRAAWEAAIKAGRDVSISTLARELGVSRATAYRAVNGD
jgi:hypothetical protein